MGEWIPKVGEKVRVRDWEDMENEFGLNQWGSIKCENSFTREMDYLCGGIFTVRQLIGDDERDIKFVEHDADDYYISSDMIEPFYGDSYNEELVSSQCFSDFLNSIAVL